MLASPVVTPRTSGKGEGWDCIASVAPLVYTTRADVVVDVVAVVAVVAVSAADSPRTPAGAVEAHSTPARMRVTHPTFTRRQLWGCLGPGARFLCLYLRASSLNPDASNASAPSRFMCYELDYGSAQCKAWDVGKHPYCAPDPTGNTALPAWCAQPWCYVDKETCKHTTNKIFLSHNIYARDLYFSYDACAGNSTRVPVVAVRVAGARKPTGRNPLHAALSPIARTMLCACCTQPRLASVRALRAF